MNETATANSREGGRAELVMEVGRSLLSLGAPAHRLEDAMQLVARRLGLEGQFYCTPTALIATLGRGKDRRTHMSRVEDTGMDLGKLAAIHEVMESLSRDESGPVAAIRKVREIMDGPPTHRPVLMPLASLLVASAVAIILGAGPVELALAALLGLQTGLLGKLFGSGRAVPRLFPAAAGLLAALVAGLAAAFTEPISLFLVIVAGLIVLMPGLAIALAARELGTGHLVSGSAHMAGAIFTLLLVGFGVALGTELAQMATGPLVPGDGTADMPIWTRWVAVLAAAVGFTMLFGAPTSQLGWIFLGSILAAEVGGRAADAFNPALGALLGALCVGVLGNLYARLRNRPASLVHMPGIMLLVPGSLGFGGLTSLLADDPVGGVQIGFTVALVATGLATGLLLASALVPPRRVL